MSHANKRERQELLAERYQFEYLGNGPRSSGGPDWRMTPRLFFRCGECGYLMSAAPDESDACYCGAIRKDAEDGFATTLGDSRVQVFSWRKRR